MNVSESREYLLSIPAVCYRLVLIVFYNDMLKLSVGDVFYYVPFYRKEPIPLIFLPKIHTFFEINLTDHLSQANKLPTFVYLKWIKEISGSSRVQRSFKWLIYKIWKV